MIDLSIVIPAYNEEKRLPKTLEQIIAYMRTRKESFEIVVVNDGSRDGTVQFVEGFIKKNKEVRLLSHFPNRGRGAAVKEGMLSAEGEIIIETDADNSTDNEAIGRFFDYLKDHPQVGVVFGNREAKDTVMVKEQPALRIFLGKSFIYLSRALFWMWDVGDFSLGFKMFRKAVARDIFTHQYNEQYVAEAEIIFLARARKHIYAQLPVIWTDDRDSRIHPFRDSFRSFLGMLKILGNYFRGRY